MRGSKCAGWSLWVLLPLIGCTGTVCAQEVLPTISVDATGDGEPAEATASTSSRGLSTDEIVVTAQKREESINDVPIAISAFTGEDLDALGVTDTRDLNTLVPGFKYGESGYNTPVYSLRGVGFNEASQTASATVGVYADEINLPFPIMSKGANLDLERVEVLKGPQGTLYGRNTTGGAVNYIANRPDDSFESGIKLNLARFETTDVEGFLSGPLGDAWGARLALRDIRSQQGWQRSNTRPGDRLGRQDKQAGRLILDGRPADTLGVAFTISGWRDGGEPQAPQAVGFRAQNQILGGMYEMLGQSRDNALDPSVRSQPLVPRKGANPRSADWTPELAFELDDSFYSAAARADWDVQDSLRLSLLSSYLKFRSNDSTIPQSGLGVTAGERAIDVDTDAQSVELRLGGDWGERSDWITGLFYSHDDVAEVQDIYVGKLSTGFPTSVSLASVSLQALLGPGVVLPSAGNALIDRALFTGDQRAESLAAFAHLGWSFRETFKLGLGLRYTTEQRAFTGCTRDSPDRTEGIGLSAAFTAISLSQGGNGMVPDDGCVSLDEQTRDPGAFTGRLEEDNLSGRIALDWQPDEDSLFYGAFSRGFKSGSFPVLSSAEQKQYEPVTQEQLNAFELGAKLSIRERRAQVNHALFYYDYKDKQLLGNLLDPVFGPLPILVNAPKSRVIGAELDGRISPVDGLFLAASLAYLDTRVTEFIGTDENGQTEDFAGRRFNFAPRLTYTLLANYTLPLRDRYDLSLGADYSYSGSTNSSLGEEPEFAHPDYFLLNLRSDVGPMTGPWKIGAWMRNVTNELTTISITKPSDSYTRYVGQPRTFGLSLSWRFE